MPAFFTQYFQQWSKLIQPQWTLVICGGVCSLLYGYLCLASRNFGGADVIDLWVVGFSAALLSIVTWYHYHSANNRQAYANKACYMMPIGWMLGFALVFRVIGFFTFPVLEDDFYRYLWDGRMLVETGSPYAIAPDTYFDDSNVSDAFQTILSNINYPTIATVYGPTNQWLFGLAYIIAPASLWPIKLMILIADVALIFTLLSLMRHHAIPTYFLVLYAWCPLLIKEFVITAHPDIIAVALMFAALLAWQRHFFLLAAAAIALAAGAKVFALIVAPLILGLDWRRWVLFAAVACAIAWPLGLVDAWLPEGLQAMATAWLFNAPIYLLLLPFISFTTLKFSLLILFALFWSIGALRHWWLAATFALRGHILFGALLLCLPALNAWYFIWVLPFGVFYPSRALWAAATMLLLSYGEGIASQTGDQHALSNLLLLAEFGVVLVALAFDLRAYRKTKLLAAAR